MSEPVPQADSAEIDGSVTWPDGISVSLLTVHVAGSVEIQDPTDLPRVGLSPWAERTSAVTEIEITALGLIRSAEAVMVSCIVREMRSVSHSLGGVGRRFGSPLIECANRTRRRVGGDVW